MEEIGEDPSGGKGRSKIQIIIKMDIKRDVQGLKELYERLKKSSDAHIFEEDQKRLMGDEFQKKVKDFLTRYEKPIVLLTRNNDKVHSLRYTADYFTFRGLKFYKSN